MKHRTCKLLIIKFHAKSQVSVKICALIQRAFLGHRQWTNPLQNSGIHISRYFLKIRQLTTLHRKERKGMLFLSTVLWGLPLKLWLDINTEWEVWDMYLKILISVWFIWLLIIDWPLLLFLICMTPLLSYKEEQPFVPGVKFTDLVATFSELLKLSAAAGKVETRQWVPELGMNHCCGTLEMLQSLYPNNKDLNRT